MSDIVSTNIFIDTSDVKALLNYQGGDIDKALSETIEHTPEPESLQNWRNNLQRITGQANTLKASKLLNNFAPPLGKISLRKLSNNAQQH